MITWVNLAQLRVSRILLLAAAVTASAIKLSILLAWPPPSVHYVPETTRGHRIEERAWNF